jgi:hypothetical protein
MDASLLGYLAVGAGGGYLAGTLSGAPWQVLTLGVLGLSAVYFVESGGTGLPYPEWGAGDGGGEGDPAGGSGDYTAIIDAAIAYAQHYGYTITDTGGYLDGHLMRCEPMGAIALHASLGTCAWKYCDIPTIVAQRLGKTEEWVMDFHDGFHHDQYPGWAHPDSDGYQVGLSYRQKYLPGAA